MKHVKTLLITCSVIGVFIASCAKEGLENGNPRIGPSNGALGTYLASIAPAQTFSVNNSNGGTITGLRGTDISFLPGAFVLPNGNPVTGYITVELIEALNKKEIIATGAFTTADGIPIQSGGEIRLRAWQGSQQLEIAYTGAVVAGIPAGANPIAGMQLFTADTIDADQDFTLRDSMNVNTVFDSSSFAGVNYNYVFYPPNVGWTNVDQYMNNAAALVEYSVSVPSIFNQTNSMCYISFNDYNAVATAYYFDTEANAFDCGPYYRLPVGLDVTFIVISEIGGQFYYGEQQVTVGLSCAVSIVPQICTQAFVDQKLSAL